MCQKRSLATIATHDLNLIKTNIIYDAKEPDDIDVRFLIPFNLNIV
jgi:hypothetical protein